MTPTNENAPGLAGHEGAELKTADSPDSIAATLRLSPRQERVLTALSATAGWIAREALDRIAGASNSPDVVLRLRRKLGDDAIDMRQVDALDRDNRPCRPGQYRLTAQGRQRLAQIQQERAPC